MNKKQLNRFSVISWILMIIFIGLDRLYNCSYLNEVGYFGKLDLYGIFCVIHSEMYEPFIWLFALLGVSFLIMSWLEKEK